MSCIVISRENAEVPPLTRGPPPPPNPLCMRMTTVLVTTCPSLALQVAAMVAVLALLSWTPAQRMKITAASTRQTAPHPRQCACLHCMRNAMPSRTSAMAAAQGTELCTRTESLDSRSPGERCPPACEPVKGAFSVEDACKQSWYVFSEAGKRMATCKGRERAAVSQAWAWPIK